MKNITKLSIIIGIFITCLFLFKLDVFGGIFDNKQANKIGEFNSHPYTCFIYRLEYKGHEYLVNSSGGIIEVK